MKDNYNPRLSRSPLIHSARSVDDLMRDVLIALIPGALMACWFHGLGVLIQIGLGAVGALVAEAVLLAIRGRPVRLTLNDHSALITGILLGLSVPPLTPWWAGFTGAILAITFGKQVYGGLGQNPFNPAMIGYAMLMLSFPREMTLWAGTGADLPSLGLSLTAIFGTPPEAWWDSVARATPLTRLHDGVRAMSQTGLTQIYHDMTPSVLVNLAYLVGGCVLMARKTLDYRIPLAMLATLFLGDRWLQPFASEGAGSLEQLFLGSTMLGAFFIATDPVTAASTPRGRWLYGASIGALTLLIRAFGNYPDGIAFAVLLMNFAAPSLDNFTRPRVYGHS